MVGPRGPIPYQTMKHQTHLSLLSSPKFRENGQKLCANSSLEDFANAENSIYTERYQCFLSNMHDNKQQITNSEPFFLPHQCQWWNQQNKRPHHFSSVSRTGPQGFHNFTACNPPLQLTRAEVTGCTLTVEGCRDLWRESTPDDINVGKANTE